MNDIGYFTQPKSNKLKITYKVVRLLATGQIRYALYEIAPRYYRFLSPTRWKKTGVHILDEVWDHLIILDACRYDDFSTVNMLPGELEKRTSLGSNTYEWLRKNFTGYYDDIVYVSANPYCSGHEIAGFRGTEHFFEVENVWDYGWDDTLDTVHPEAVKEAATRVHARYPDKRLIIHFIQPHGPWIARQSRESGLDLADEKGKKWSADKRAWQMVKEGQLDVGVARQAARENLGLVLQSVKDLVRHLSGHIVITSDHGDCFGEHFLLEHPEGLRVRELVEVPWFKVAPSITGLCTERVDYSEINQRESDSRVVEDRLRSLGYFD